MENKKIDVMPRAIVNPFNEIYLILRKSQGFQNWWPSDCPFETIIGAILTQNVSWINAKKSIDNLKSNSLLNPYSLSNLNEEDIAILIKSSRFYNQKAKKIKNFVSFLINEYSGDILLMKKEDMLILRNRLLQIKGLGPETVDSILLYACNMPSFVVDAYTKRIFKRLGLIEDNLSYGEVQSIFINNLDCNIDLYNDYHAQLVVFGNSICKSKPLCKKCPLLKNGIRCSSFYSIDD